MSGVLGLFPAFQTFDAGGIQVIGRLAWEAVQRSYPDARLLQVDLAESTPANERTIARSRTDAIARTMRLRRPDDTLLCWHADLLPLSLFARARRVALFLHGIEVWRRPNPLQRIALRSVDRIIANSQHTLDRARTFGFVPARASTSVVHLGLDAPVDYIARPKSPPAAVMLGRLDRRERYKGHQEVVRAWPQVRARIPKAQLWIAGDGNQRGELQRLAATEGLRDTIIFYGRISEERKASMLEQSHCLLMPSSAEGFGLVYIEAMRYGRPCLVGHNDAGREVVRPPECGLAVDPLNSDALADAIVRLMSDSDEWRQWSAQSRLRYASDYTGTAFQQRLLSALEA